MSKQEIIYQQNRQIYEANTVLKVGCEAMISNIALIFNRPTLGSLESHPHMLVS